MVLQPPRRGFLQATFEKLEEESRQCAEEERQKVESPEEERRQTENDEVEMERHFNTEENSQENLVLMTPVQRAMLQDRAHTEMESLNDDRVTLDIGGRHFATSRRALLSQPNSLFHSLMEEEKSHYDIDRDGGHF